jgi:hypothetical protein
MPTTLRGLAHLVRAGWYREVRVKGRSAMLAKALLGARSQLLSMSLAKRSLTSSTRLDNEPIWSAIAKQSTMNRLQHALEIEGIEFIDENGGGVGVWLRKQKKG